MVRDPLRNADYYEKYIKFEDETIIEFQELLDEVIEQRGINDEGAQDGLKSINVFYFNKLNAMYSGGWDLKEIKELVHVIIDSMEKAWTGHYLQMLWILSIGIMLEIDQKFIERLEKLVKEYHLEDKLIDYLLSSRITFPQRTGNSLLHKDPYQKLIDLIHLEDKQQQVSLLKEYLEFHWYPGHEDTGWYNSHMHKDDIYNGYWSYESGAVAKILGLDDESLNGISYYPFDMVHYKD